jgi:serine/threonine-protein kinase
MLVGQQLGPFVIEKEIGTGAMGAVYRGKYTKTGQRVAIKVMAPGLATSAHSAARFDREAGILKQFNHPNIVRLFGSGKFQGTRYYAMEFLDGESLDKIMARRAKLSWEEVVDLGQQLCAALNHAHMQGIIHRDLKPSNLMVLEDGTLKLTDFGIAKDLDVTGLTETNCTVGTASYMSPEQCRGERNLTHKSDLYSMGVLFYELITGQKPFQAETAMDMFMQHVKGTFERPSRRVLDIPVWLDNLICQLLEKKPEQRPLDAAMVGNVLGSIREKVEAQESAGVDAVRARRIDRAHGRPRADDADRDAARALTGKKPKKKRTHFYEKMWFQAVGLIAILAALAGILYFVFKPASAETLYQQAKKLMESTNPEDRDRALDDKGPITLYLAHYAKRPGPETEQIRKWKTEVEIDQCERLLANYLAKKAKKIKLPEQSDAEKEGFKAADAEDEGDLDKALERWVKMREQFGPGSGFTSWGLTAEKHAKDIEAFNKAEKDYRAIYDKIAAGKDLDEIAKEEGEPLSSEQQRALFKALRYEWFGDVAAAVRIFETLKQDYAENPALRPFYLFAANKERTLKHKYPTRDKNPTEVVKEKLSEAESKPNDKRSRGTCLHVIALYDKDEAMQKYVQQAQDLLKKQTP